MSDVKLSDMGHPVRWRLDAGYFTLRMVQRSEARLVLVR